ncbi:MAG: DUF1566 domain-containing protein [Betaproteobacteria bacterium]|nr:MAG: DUF1566 domain-containing protein [Betaproteobacteria bacterium]
MNRLLKGIRRCSPGLVVSLATLALPQVNALNDTGTTACYTNNQFPTSCTAAVISDSGTHPRQDSRLGRDANPSPGKIGAGAAGFDFTKISNAGNALPASATLGAGANDWACTRDNVTGLLWEVKTSNPSTPGLRDVANTYTWYNPNAASNGGDAGSTGNTTSCNGTLAACNTQDYIAAVNAANLCGRSDWRLPDYKDAFTIFNSQTLGNSTPTPFDPTYFLARGSSTFTTNTLIQQPNSVFYVDSSGMSFASKTSLARQVRLVAGTNAFR